MLFRHFFVDANFNADKVHRDTVLLPGFFQLHKWNNYCIYIDWRRFHDGYIYSLFCLFWRKCYIYIYVFMCIYLAHMVNVMATTQYMLCAGQFAARDLLPEAHVARHGWREDAVSSSHQLCAMLSRLSFFTNGSWSNSGVDSRGLIFMFRWCL